MPASRRPVVLLVQPSRDDGLEMYTDFLRYHGLAVIPVSDSRDALMLAAQADIVVTGMNLDDPMSGVQLVSRLRHDDCTRSTPIIVLTASAWPTDRERAEGAGCDVFLLKPCLPNDLLREVWQLLTAQAGGGRRTRCSCLPTAMSGVRANARCRTSRKRLSRTCSGPHAHV
jgi:CheY-like chemotaxis protein